MNCNTKLVAVLLTTALTVPLLAGCARANAAQSEPGIPDKTEILVDEMIPLTESQPAVPLDYTTEAPGVLTMQNSYAVVDYSNSQDGYVMVQYTAATTKRLKVQVKGPTTTYTYNLTAGKWETFPLSDGNGKYQVVVYENVVDNKYAIKLTVPIEVALADEFAPFLHPNQYVDYGVAVNTIQKAAELTKDMTKPLDKVAAIYEFVTGNITYDQELARTVKSGYLPVLDTVLANKKGICFDYAALMAGMLRSQNIPCKLVIGYAGTVYHAWISVYTEEAGWIESVIYFDGAAWQRMDPTFASTGKKSSSTMKYIGNGKNYSVKYLY